MRSRTPAGVDMDGHKATYEELAFHKAFRPYVAGISRRLARVGRRALVVAADVAARARNFIK